MTGQFFCLILFEIKALNSFFSLACKISLFAMPVICVRGARLFLLQTLCRSDFGICQIYDSTSHLKKIRGV